MKKLIFSLFFIWLLMVPALADYTVDSIKVSAEVDSEGIAQVTSTVQLTFDTETDSVAIPLPEGIISNVAADVSCRISSDNDGLYTVTVSQSGGFTGTRSFTVSYTESSGYLSEDSYESYTLNLLSSRWAKTISSFSYHITFPGAYTELEETYTLSPEVTSGYFGAMDSSELSQTVSGNVVDGSVTRRMAYDSLQLQAQLPVGYFKPEESLIPGVNLSRLAVAMAAVWLLCMVYWFLRIRTAHVQQASARTMAPEGLLPCELPMAIDGSTCDLAALVLEWANLGYVSFRCGRKKQVKLIRIMSMGSERSRAERELFHRVFYKRRGVLLQPGRFSGEAARFRAASRRSLSRILFDRRGGNPRLLRYPACLISAVGIAYMAYTAMPSGGGYLVLAILAGIAGFFYSLQLYSSIQQLRALGQVSLKTFPLLLVAAAVIVAGLFFGAFLESLIGILSCIIIAAVAASGPRRSKRGQDALIQTRGCRMFYKNVSWSRLQVAMGDDNRFFQKQLPQAVSLRLDRSFARRFERIGVPRPEWVKGLHPKDSSAAALQKQLNIVIRALRKAFR